ncbi:MAG TPA: hypothetical protein VIJ46_06105 [Rhabdochlamydiaceae bacterium]
MTIELIKGITDTARSAFYVAEAAFYPLTLPYDVNEIFKATRAHDEEKVLDHAVSIINVPVNTGYAATSAALAIDMLMPAASPAIHALGVVSGGLGIAAAAITIIPEGLGLARAVRMAKHIDTSDPEETLNWVRGRYLRNPVGEVKLERRVGKWLTKEIKEGNLSDAELAQQLKVQNTKKVVAHVFGIIALVASIATFIALISGVGMIYLAPLYAVFGAFLIAKYVIESGIFEHKGWEIDYAALVPDIVKKAAHGLSCVFSDGFNVLINALNVEKALPLSVKSSS